MIIADKAVIKWARRYSRLAKIMAENFETDPKRKEELLKLSDICWRVPAEPCNGFWDAMQAKWFVYLVCHSLEKYASGFSHKEDEVLWPYYKKSVIDKEFQAMTREDAQELVECERLKITEHGAERGRAHREAHAGANDLFILTIGGVKSDGSDACSEMSDVILDAAASIVTTEPSIGFRWHPKANIETLKRVHKCISLGLGYPSIKNDDIAIRQLVGFGATEEQARNWALVLCMSPGVVGRFGQRTRQEGGGCVMPGKIFELALTDGYDETFSGEQIGPHTGDASKFKSYEEVVKAYRQQLRQALFAYERARAVTRMAESKICQVPFLSSTYDGCIERGVDGTEWSELPNPWINYTGGNINNVDSLAAMKKLIFEEKKYTMEQLMQALRDDWEGHEKMREDFLNAPKFGNDDDYVDMIAKDIYKLNSDETARVIGWSGAPTKPLGQAVGIYWVWGARTGALPCGRRAGEPMDDGGISPFAGCDKKGPTAVLKSVGKVDTAGWKGILLNQRLSPAIMTGDKGFELWLNFMKTWDDLGCDHVQFNVFNVEDLRAAQKEPEKYPDLIVRVAGYSARFVDLSRFAQDSVIARGEQQLG
jgi:pyruvate-formate lyase